MQETFSENGNTSRNFNKPHFQPIDSFIDLLKEGKETVLSAVTSGNITVRNRTFTNHRLIPFNSNPLNWPEFIKNFKERVHLEKSFLIV